MSNGSSPEPQSTPKKQRRRLWTTTGLAIGAIATLSVAGVAIAAWRFAHETLSPWASDYLTEALDRPVALGEVERVSITGVQFGPSAMPPTATDPDTLYVETIAVRFNPLGLLGRQVNPQITLTGVQVYIEQDEQGKWVEVDINLDDDDDDEDRGEPFIRVNPTVIFADSEVQLLPYLGPDESPQVFTLNDINGTVAVQKVVVDNPRAGGKPQLDAQEITLDFSSRPENAGDLDLSGVIRQLDYGDNAPPNLLDSLEANIAVQAQAIDLAALSPLVFASAGERLPLAITAGLLNGNIAAELTPFEAPRLTGTASLEDGELFIDALSTPFSEINTQARFQGNRIALEETTATFGELKAEARGIIDPRNGYDLTGAIAPVTLEGIAETFNFEYPVEMAATLQAPKVALTGPLAKPTVSGLVETVDGGTIDQVEFARVASEVTYSREGFQFADLVANPLAGGELTGNGELRFGRPVAIAFDLLGTDLPADDLARLYGLPDDISIGTLALEADIAGPVKSLTGVFTWDAVGGTYPTRGTAELERNLLTLRQAEIAGGTVSGVGRLNQGQWTADVQAQGLQMGFFNAALQGVTAGGDVRLGGSTRDFSLAGLQGDGNIVAALAGGTLNSTFNLANGTWQADGQGRNLQLQQLSSDLRGTGSATFQLAGSLANLSPAAIRGRANIQLSDGLATARALNPAFGRSPAPLDASLAWDGRLLRIDSLETGGLFASGTVTPQLSGSGAPSIAAIDLNLAANNYDLATLPVNFPPALALVGIADLQGRLTGSPSNLNFEGDLTLANLALNDLVFDRRLAGPVTYSNQRGLAVGLMGTEDQITATYVPQTRQLNAEIRAGEAIATATTEGDLLQAQLYNFPVSVLNIPAEPSPYGSLRGLVDFANASINLRTGEAIGQFDVAYLGFGYVNVDRLYGGFRYADGVAQLNEGQIIMADRDERGAAIATRTYNVSGRYSLGQTPQLVGTLSSEAGELRDLLQMLQIQELADFRRGLQPNEGFIPASTLEAAKILATNPVGSPNDTLLNQLRRLSEIIEIQILDEIAAEEAPIPPLSELQGSFAGRVNITATLPTDLRATFDLAGQNWSWGPDIRADQMVAQGSYQNGLVTFAPLQFNSNEETGIASAALTGSFSLDPQDRTDREMLLQITNVPISNLEDFANLPFDLDGRLNSTAILGGRLGNPRLTGELEVIDGTLNGTGISNTTAAFSYINARAGLDAQLSLIGSNDPLTLTAAVPYQLGFVDIEPVDQSYLLRANVKDEGLALLNLFTQQVAWEDGQGEVVLNIAGDLQTNNSLPETFQGLITLDDATISASALPVPMTDVTGRIRLVPSIQAIEVEQLTGQFSEGQLSAQGLFPLLLPLDTFVDFADDDTEPPQGEDETAPPPAADDTEPSETSNPQYQPLTLNLDNIALDLQGLYEGQVDGEMQLVGSLLLGPQLTGAIDLSQGTLIIPEGGGPPPVAAVDRNGGDSIFPPFAFSDLRILLRRGINIVQGNYLDVRAQGGLRLDGTLSTLRPTGTIQLPSGRIGLFAVELRLAGENDRADFRGTFDPLLDVTLQTSLPETNTSGIQVTRGPFPRNEVPDTTTLESIGLTQQGNRLVRIRARYTGPASELANITTTSRNLSLSSSPPRSESEIVGLLSGNVIGAIDALGSDNALTGIGTFVGSALLNTVREFLGDTVPISEVRLFQVSDASGGVEANDGSDIGAEVGFEISPTISVSVLKVITNDTPFQFNTRYRLSDEFTLRGTTSYEDFRERSGVLLEYETRF
ncbi:translocation/assembly module TamB domain-containing protein [Leptolyngbya iicbica]|uniref:Translocation and assembly module TamB C-terminal domain-containing protein n=2 Tax=Cyanophyceae TaxID=3028117 RepID=A0A4Q7E2I0_9CYAN|nr:translocation/assembly module TamB domain-containing protein [Leptolyngbya sp. LK]RZM76007.1 hypothetical protein DYY88_19105 [Leptolyngbya sp. LK]